MPYSDNELHQMQLRAEVMKTALQSASMNTIKSPMTYVEELWSWVADVGQPAKPAPTSAPKRATKKTG